MAYLLDSNVFIQAKNLHYSFDFCPAFWDWLDIAHRSGTVFSIEKVGDEIKGQEDELTRWAAEREDFFLKPDSAVIPSLQAVSRWSNSGNYKAAAVDTFLQVADYYLVAQAHAHGHVVVTHERVTHQITKIKIPTACIELGVRQT